LAGTNTKGVPVFSIVLGTIIGCAAFGPFPSWSSLVNAVTGATAVMYGMAPIALGALRVSDADRPRTYKIPAPGFVLPASFASANLILYFGGFDTMYKVIGALVLGLVLFGIGSSVVHTGDLKMVKHALWVPGWLVGMLVISALGRYGDSQLNVLPAWIDLIVVIAFSWAIYYWAVRLTLPHDDVQEQLARDAHQLSSV
jgi:amino acid transporter